MAYNRSIGGKSRRFSPYVYCNNNPINFIDMDGMLADSTKGTLIVNGGVLQEAVVKFKRKLSETSNAILLFWPNNLANAVGGVASTYSGLRYTERPFNLPGSYFSTSKAKTYSFSDLKPKNGKFRQGVQGLRNAKNYAKYKVRWLSRAGATLGFAGIAYSGLQFYKQQNLENSIDLAISIGAAIYWEIGAVAVIGSILASPGIEQRQENILNNRPINEGVYNPGTGDFDRTAIIFGMKVTM